LVAAELRPFTRLLHGPHELLESVVFATDPSKGVDYRDKLVEARRVG
jgi:hypothetical protein